jgi:membrane fusion protein, heavy metal efflux system
MRNILPVCLFAFLLGGCSKRATELASTSDTTVGAKEPARPPEQISANAANVVVLGPDAPELRQMTIEPVHSVTVPADEITAPAKIEVNPNRMGHAMLPAPGRIVRVMVKLGDSVGQGQPVVAIESSVVAEAESGHIQSDASVRQAELAVAKAEADLARETDLFEHQAIAQKEVLAAQTTAELAKASLEQARSAREQARRRLELLGLKVGQFQQQIVVTAPISGKVLEVSVVAGEYRNEINTPLVTIADLSRVWATSEVPESKIRYCKVGGTADLELIAYPNETFRARVTRIADTVGSETRTIKVSAEIENIGGRLRPEMFGQLRYADGLTPSPWVPDSAVVRIGDKALVFLEQGPGRFISSPVELGKRQDGGFSIAKGLKTGDRVVTQGSVYLKAAL